VNRIEGDLPARLVTWVLLESGLDPQESGRFFDMQHPRRPSNGPVSGSYRFALSESSEESCSVSLSTRSPTDKVIHVCVEVASHDLASRLRSLFEQYEATVDGESYRDFAAISAAQAADARRVEQALTAARLTPPSADRRQRRLDEQTARVLMEVFAVGGHRARSAVLFKLQAPRTPRPVKSALGDWLIREFPKFENRRLRGEIGAALIDLVRPEHGERLVALMADERLRSSRSALCLPLAMSKCPSAGEVLSELLGGELRLAALHGLAKLGKAAAAEASAVEQFVQHPDPAVRRIAEKVLVRMGAVAPNPPEPAHLVKDKSEGPPVRDREWSVNLDSVELEEALGVIGSAFDEGFGQPEIAEVVAVADRMMVDQVRQFRFPVRIGNTRSDVWIGLFMDDEEAPDLYVYAEPDVLGRVDAAWRRSRFSVTLPNVNPR
jgi:hypothetical protein